MILSEIISRSSLGFIARFECEFCKNTQVNHGSENYDFYYKDILKLKCGKCKKSTRDDRV